jgi:hypothetical protein
MGQDGVNITRMPCLNLFKETVSGYMNKNIVQFMYRYRIHAAVINIQEIYDTFYYFKTILKVHKIENFFGSEFEVFTFSLLVLLKY